MNDHQTNDDQASAASESTDDAAGDLHEVLPDDPNLVPNDSSLVPNDSSLVPDYSSLDDVTAEVDGRNDDDRTEVDGDDQLPAAEVSPFAAPPRLSTDHTTTSGPGTDDGRDTPDVAVGPITTPRPKRTLHSVARSRALRLRRRARLTPATSSVFRPSRFAWAGQVLRSTLLSVIRNGPLTLAGVLCASVALSLVGASLLVSEGVNNATIRWRGGVETIVFVEPGASQTFIDDIGSELADNPAVADTTFVSQKDAYEEFKVMFRNSPELVSSIKATDLPASWRVVPHDDVSNDTIAAIGDPFVDRAGIFQVVYARDAVQSVMNVSKVVRVGLLGLAVTLGLAAWLLVWTTCRTAAWARRDELSVMRLVGAPRWLVRLPFVAEGALQGLAGGVVGSVAVWTLSGIIERKVVEGDSLAILRNFSVESASVTRICVTLAVGGAIAGAVGATLAVGRYVAAGDGVPVTVAGRARSFAKSLFGRRDRAVIAGAGRRVGG